MLEMHLSLSDLLWSTDLLHFLCERIHQIWVEVSEQLECGLHHHPQRCQRGISSEQY